MKKVILSLVFVLATGTTFMNASSSEIEVTTISTDTTIYVNCLDEVYDLAVHLHPDDEEKQLQTFIKAYKYLCS